MAFNTNKPYVKYIAGLNQTIYTFDFKIFTKSDLIVEQGDLFNNFVTLDPSQYTLVINGDLGGQLTLNVALPEGYSLILKRELPIDRNIEYQKNGDLKAEELNDDQEYQTYLISDRATITENVYTNKTGFEDISTEMPFPEANRYLRWNDTETALINGDPTGSGADLNYNRVDGKATEGQIQINVDPFNAAAAQVYVNGVLLQQGNDYYLNGNIIVLNNPMEVDDEYTAITKSVGNPEIDYNKTEYLATEGQTSFPYDNLTVNIDVYVNGSLYPSSTYTIGNEILTFNTPLSLDDEVIFVTGQVSNTLKNTDLVVYVATLAELTSLNPATVTTAIWQDENRGGTFNYDATQIRENNGGTIFNGWVRQYDGAVNIKWFGAKSITEAGYETFNSTKAIQDALDSSNNVYIDDGIYMSTGLELKHSTVVQSKQGVIKAFSTNTSRLVSLNAGSIQSSLCDIVFDCVTFDGGYDGTNGITASSDNQHVHILSMHNYNSLDVRNCKFVNPRGDCIYIGDTEVPQATGTVHNILSNISNCSFVGNNDERNGVSLILAESVSITGCKFKNISHSTMPGSIDIEPNKAGQKVESVLINNNTFSGSVSSYLVLYFNSLVDYIGEYTVTMNTFNETSKGIPLHIFKDNSIDYSLKPRISANTLNNTHDGIVLRNTNGATLENNIFNSTSGEASIKVGYGTGRLSKNTIIVNNTFNKSVNYGVMLFESEDTVIVNNLFDSTLRQDVYMATSLNTDIKINENIFSDTYSISLNGSVKGVDVTESIASTVDITRNIVTKRYASEYPSFKQDDCLLTDIFSFNTLPSVFPKGMSVSAVNNSSIPGPDGITYGILMTHKHSTNNTAGFNYQDFKPRYIDGIPSNDARYTRSIIDDNTFSPWVNIQGSTYTNFSLKTIPTSDPLVAGQLWNNAGVVTVSAG